MKFISPKTDFAFKKIFGFTDSKNILISFLNAILYGGELTIKYLEKREMFLEDQQGAIIVSLNDS